MSNQASILYDIDDRYDDAVEENEYMKKKKIPSAVVKQFEDSHSEPLNFRQDSVDAEKKETLLVSTEMPKNKPRPGSFETIKEWVGIVEEIREDIFIARVGEIGIENYSAYEQKAEIPLVEVTRDDLKLVEPGAYFYWCIGYDISSSGQKTRESTIRFRRLPAWNSLTIKDVKAKAREKKAKLGW